ncbi:MAG: MoxR family ATPase [Clostridiales bacterium]|nr:MoxR family ATPase [Clostridiales bacterium]
MAKVKDQVIEEVKKVICGKDEVIKLALTGMLSGGHILIEDVPGVGKTSMALAFSKAMGLDYGRVQFTPDVLPSDITGFTIFDKDTKEMHYKKGAIFHNLFLADELNRASSRTQSAFLEAMEEGQVTVDEKTYPLPDPFIVFATQNPSGASGTSLLPDSQMDRFTVRISMGYPGREDEKAMIMNRQEGKVPMQTIERICTSDDMLRMRKEAAQVHLRDKLLDYVVALVEATRNHPDLERGASPRATLALTAMAKAYAYMHDRDVVTEDDVRAVFCPVMSHRLLLTPEAEFNELKTDAIAEEILKTTTLARV